MFRTLIRHSERFACLLLLAGLAGGAFAQAQNKTVDTTGLPANLIITRPCCPTGAKPVERIPEPAKFLVQSNANQQAVRQGIAVGEKTGQGAPGNDKNKGTDTRGQGATVKELETTPRNIDPNCPRCPKPATQNGPSGVSPKADGDPKNHPPKKEVEGLKGVGKPGDRVILIGGQPGQGEPSRLPQRTKDAAGSPQKPKQKDDEKQAIEEVRRARTQNGDEKRIAEPTPEELRRGRTRIDEGKKAVEQNDGPVRDIRTRGSQGTILIPATEDPKKAKANDKKDKEEKLKKETDGPKRSVQDDPKLLRRRLN